MNPQDILLAQIKSLLENHKMKVGYAYSFPQYKIFPKHVQLAIAVLEAEGMKIEMTVVPKDQPVVSQLEPQK